VCIWSCHSDSCCISPVVTQCVGTRHVLLLVHIFRCHNMTLIAYVIQQAGLSIIQEGGLCGILMDSTVVFGLQAG
jgi:hypothetical protein